MKFVDLFSSSFTLSVYFLIRWLKISRVLQKFKVKTSMIFGIMLLRKKEEFGHFSGDLVVLDFYYYIILFI